MKISKPPVQYNFAEKWEKEILPLKKHPSVKSNFATIRLFYKHLEKSLRRETGDNSLSLVKFREDLKLLRDLFDGIDLKFLTLSIAEALYPDKEWEIVGFQGEDAVVTDDKRTLVFDMKNFDKLSATASLVLCEDEVVVATKEVIAEVHLFLKNRAQRENAESDEESIGRQWNN
jgi:hypothetical protein